MSPLTGEHTRFSRSDRLLSAGDYSRVFAGAARSSDRYFTVLARPNDLTHARLGLVVAKKNIKTAVQRNRVKRVIREAFRLGKLAMPSHDLVVIVKASAATADNALLRAALARIWFPSTSHAHPVAVAN
ncbi:ribonuclease P protein component [Methylogaea oryzae]|uniref:ribonuclease P protein component n=1 Tax=Methylogaea oryzae TaxID=1295382 RepID=UPI001FEAF052|nr:ribonuclease P protein component [Methylogaea oryzae]